MVFGVVETSVAWLTSASVQGYYHHELRGRRREEKRREERRGEERVKTSQIYMYKVRLGQVRLGQVEGESETSQLFMYKVSMKKTTTNNNTKTSEIYQVRMQIKEVNYILLVRKRIMIKKKHV